MLRPARAGDAEALCLLGFSRVGVYHEQGMLDGKWVDTLIMEKLCSNRTSVVPSGYCWERFKAWIASAMSRLMRARARL